MLHSTEHYIKINIHEYYNYIDDILDLESYKNYDPIIRGILIQDSVWSNPSHTVDFSSLNILHLK